MRLLLDECVPRPLRKEFAGHEILTIEEAGFKGLKNGALLRIASTGFDVLITVDKNIEYQQNTGNLPMAVMIISARTNRIENLLPLIPDALIELSNIKSGEIIKIEEQS